MTLKIGRRARLLSFGGNRTDRPTAQSTRGMKSQQAQANQPIHLMIFSENMQANLTLLPEKAMLKSKTDAEPAESGIEDEIEI